VASCLVTGGGGFVGSNLVAALLADGATVRVADNFSTGRRDNLPRRHPCLEVVEGDLADLEFARVVVRQVEYVLHQAALPSVPRSVRDPIASNDAGVGATLNVLVAAKDAGVRRVVYASSSSVYGEAVAGPKREDMPLAPLSPYAVSKMAGEHYCRAFHAVYGLETVALRYFNVFGPRQDPASEYAAVIPKFIVALLGGGAPTIYGDGEQTRDFTFVGNVVAANLRALTVPGIGGGFFNIAMGQGTSLNRLVELLNTTIGTSIRPQYAEVRRGDIKHSTADVSKIRAQLGFAPNVNLLDGLAQTASWYRDGR